MTRPISPIPIELTDLGLMALAPRSFQAALAGLCKRNFYGFDATINLTDLVDALYGDSGMYEASYVDKIYAFVM
jgi:hypothetical protein